MGATQTGVQAGEQTEAEYNRTPLKTVYELPEDHPMRRRAEAQDRAEEARMADFAQESGITPEPEVVDDKKIEKTAQADPAKVDPQAENLDKQIEAQGDELILTPEMIARAKVMTKVDGVDELVPASKVLGQYQKGAAADVRLADATRLRSEAQALVDKASKDAQERTATAATPAEKTEAQTQVRDVTAAKAKFKEAADALFEGDSERAATLFSEAQTLAQPPAPVITTNVDPKEMARQIRADVKQDLSQESALSTLRSDYPEIFTDSDYALLTDRAYNAHVTNGKTPAEALHAAGEQIAEKFKLGKFAKASGRPVKTAAPTTQAEKLELKKDLDNVTGDGARASAEVQREESASDIIAQIRNARPGSKQI